MSLESKHPLDNETFKKAMEEQVKFLVDNKDSLAQLARVIDKFTKKRS